eukprot:scaffold245_cov34-Tisochrysis_lutea.AAC.2
MPCGRDARLVYGHVPTRHHTSYRTGGLQSLRFEGRLPQRSCSCESDRRNSGARHRRNPARASSPRNLQPIFGIDKEAGALERRALDLWQVERGPG